MWPRMAIFLSAAQAGFSSPFYCIRSSNAQNPNVTPTFDRVTQVNLGGSLVFGGTINPEGLAGQLFLAVDRSGGPTNNNIYMVASVQPFGFNNGTDVMFARSTDGGLTFSAPHRINDDPINHNKWHWFGTLAVAPNGRIDSVWFDTRNAANNTDSQVFYSYSTDGGVTWSPNVAVSDSFNPFEGYPKQNKLGDYITIVSDNTGGDVAYSATFNFNPTRGQHEQDVYYVRVSPSGGPTPTPTATATADCYCDSDSYANSHGYTDGHGYTDCYSYANSHCNHYAKADAHAAIRADAQTASHSGAATLSPGRRWSVVDTVP